MPSVPAKHERFGDPTADLAHKREMRRRFQDLASGAGASAWMVSFTLDATGATSTTVSSASVTDGSQISLSPLTEEAACLVGKVWISGQVPNTDMAVGSFTVSHPALLGGVAAIFRGSVKG